MKTVAVFGPNKWCNYGDDLQSLVFALHLRSMGYEPIVYKLDNKIAGKCKLKTADTMDELVKDTRLCIIAGGALLKPLILPKRLLKKDFIEFENDFRCMHAAGEKYGVRFCAISMGGDGKIWPTKKYFSRYRNDFFRSSYFIDGTVRLEGDVEQMKLFEKKFAYYPDCLFSLKRFINIETPVLPKNRPIRIGFNFRKRHLPRKFIRDINEYADNNSDIEFYFATTHMDKVIYEYGINYEYLPSRDSAHIKVVHYEHPHQLLQFVAGLDVFVASKLHLGLTGLLYGTPFLAYGGMSKTEAFLKSIGGAGAIIGSDVPFSKLVASNGILRKDKRELMKLYDKDKLQKMIFESWQQFEFCSEIIDKYA